MKGEEKGIVADSRWREAKRKGRGDEELKYSCDNKNKK